jgi:hypothetical protein
MRPEILSITAHHLITADKEMTFKPHILSLFALMMFLGMAASCSKDSFGDPDGGQPSARPTMGITISLAGASSTRADGDPAISGGYEIGEGLENHLDISNGNYRIYFFDTEGKYIDTFRPFMRPTQSGQEPVNGVQTVYYWQFLGEVPSDLPLSFKLVVLANWPKYPEEASGEEAGIVDENDTGGVPYKLVKGRTTIKGLCRHADTQFDRPVSDDAGAWLDESRLIPFYGVREYNLENYVDAAYIKDGKIDGDIYIDLRQDNSNKATALPLLRALAKVEVILDNPLASFSAVSIDRVNAKGFCAPEKAENHDDYDHGYTWDSDFIRGVHLTNNGQNDDSPVGVSLTRVAAHTTADGKTVPEKWVAYIPEYRNIDSGNADGYCSIKVALSNPDPDGFRNPGEAPKDENDKRPVWDPEKQTNTIYFATNGTKASNDNNAQATGGTPGRYNIERNNIYRFTIKGMSSNLSCEVDVQPYADCPLTVDFGLMRDERGDLMVLPDSDGNLPEYFNEYMQAHSKKWPEDENSKERIELLKGDYYAMVRKSDTAEGVDYDVWVKDSDGCRVMTNLSGRQDDDQDCSTRKVRDYSQPPLSDYQEYQKDRDGHQRLQHNSDHSSVVLDHGKQMLFKTDPNMEDGNVYLVESWDETTGVFWYLKEVSTPYIATDGSIRTALGLSASDSIPEKYKAFIDDADEVITNVFHEADKTGKDIGKATIIIEKKAKEEKTTDS